MQCKYGTFNHVMHRRECQKKTEKNTHDEGKNKAGYTATPVACGWARAVFVQNAGSAVFGYILITRNLQAEYIVLRISWSANQI